MSSPDPRAEPARPLRPLWRGWPPISRPAIVCAHRENLPVLLDAACATLGAETPDGKPLRKGEFLVLHRADGELAVAERHQPDGTWLISAAGPKKSASGHPRSAG